MSKPITTAASQLLEEAKASFQKFLIESDIGDNPDAEHIYIMGYLNGKR